MSQRPSGSDPARIGRYEILAVLGEGGMARVYRAFDPELKREVALKLPHAAAMKRWSREATAVARLAHPHIISVYDIGESEGQPYLAMELIDGRQLARVWLQWPLRRRIEALHRVAQAVEYAHSRGVVHRDLKPENVMVDGQGSIKVVDFGLARVSGERSVTLTGALLGSPAYMAPEQVRGDHAAAPADIYSLGVMVYEALTGSVPFTGANARVIYERILNEDPVRPSLRNPGVPGDLETVCLKSLHKHPDRRYGSARELREDLERWLQGEAVAARPSTFMERVGRRLKRNRLAMAVGLIVVAAASVSITAVVTSATSSARRDRAAALANEASLAYAAGDIAVARSKTEEALHLVPEQPAARYWLARVKLREYRTVRGLPEVHVTTGLTIVSAPPPETPAQRALREEIVAAFRDSHGRVLAEAVLAMWAGAYDEARTLFATAGGETSPAAWEARLLEAQCLYFLGRFAEAESRLKPLLGFDPRSVDLTWGRICVARALEESQAGRDPAEWFSLADSAGRRLEEAGLAAEGRALRARAGLEAAAIDRDRGRDPGRRLDDALALLADAVRPQDWVVKGDALRMRYELGVHTGRIDSRDPNEFAPLEDAYAKAVALDASYGRGHLRLGEARRLAAVLARSSVRPYRTLIEGARESYARALALASNDAEAAIGKAWADAQLAMGDESDTKVVEAAYRGEQEVLEDLARKHPGFAPVRYHLARSRSELAWFGRTRGLDWGPVCEAALAEIDRALRVAPTYAHALKLRADILVELGIRGLDRKADPADLFRQALDSYAKAISINPTDSQLHSGRAGTFRSVARFAPSLMPADEALREGLKAADESIRLHPAFAQHYVNRAYLWRDRGQILRGDAGQVLEAFQNSIRDLDQGIRLNPRHSDAYRVKAMVLQFVSAYEAAAGRDPLPALRDAADACRRACEVDPEYAGRDAGVHLALATILFETALALQSSSQDPARAIEESLQAATRGLVVNPRNLDLIFARVRAARALAVLISRNGGDPRAMLALAEETLTSAISFHPGHPKTGTLHLDRGIVRGALGRKAEALDDFKEAVRLDPSLTERVREEMERLR